MKGIYDPDFPFKLSSAYGDRQHPKNPNAREFHPGLDYAAPAGTPIPAATSGVVVYSGRNSGFGNTVVVRNATGDYSLYAHMQDGDRAKVGQRVWPGDTIGQVGSTGELARGNHLHYSILPASAGRAIENPSLPRNGGPIGIQVNAANTIDPAKYDPQPYLDQSQRAMRMMSGQDDKSAPHEDLPFAPTQQFDIPFSKAIFLPTGKASFAPPSAAPPTAPAADLFADRYAKWASVPLPNAPAASNDPANFTDRFGNWASSPAGVLRTPGSPAPRVPDRSQRSEIPDGMTPTSATADDAPVRVLSRVNLSAAPASGDAPPLAPVAASPSLGIFSGQPMRNYPVPPPIFQLPDRSASDDDDWYQRWRNMLDA